VSQICEPATIDEAVDLLASLGADGAVLAGGTWVMREAARRRHYVSLRRLDGLSAIERNGGDIWIGALATHTDIGMIEGGPGALGALAEAARRSAFPAVRNVATLGGNLAAPFPEADLVPPLLAAEATLEIANEERAVDVQAWVNGERPAGALIVAARVPAPPSRRSWFERLTVRGGAEYSIVSVAVSVDLGTDGAVEAARVAVGAVEDVPGRVAAAEAALTGRVLDRAAGDAAGRAAKEVLRARDGLDAPGWYRLEVLPALVARAVMRLSPRRGE
jgi:aerobic carbon-monoxide dehydrogenase medium subunit